MKTIITHFMDGYNLTASHYVPMGKEKAIAAMKKDNIGEGQLPDEWFPVAFDKMEEAYNKATKKEEKATTVEAKEAASTAIQAQKAEQQVNK